MPKTTTGRPGARHRHQERSEAREQRGGVMRDWVIPIVQVVAIVLVIRTFLVHPFSIPSPSMEDTLLVGDYLMANNAIFGAYVPLVDWRMPAFRDPRVQEVVVFRPRYNQPVINVVKRVLGAPGDTVQMVDARVIRNGEPVDEPYFRHDGLPDDPIPLSARGMSVGPGVDASQYGYFWHLEALPEGVDPEGYRPTRDNWGPLIVPADHYMLLGDSRDRSLDSRQMGFIPRRDITGRPMFIYYSIDPTVDRPFPRALTAARWNRIGRGIR